MTDAESTKRPKICEHFGDAGNNNQIAITQAYNIQHMHIHLFRTCHEYTEVN